jgi:hypothetical protein
VLERSGGYTGRQIDIRLDDALHIGRAGGYGDLVMSHWGEVGIGTATPETLLDIAGRVQADGPLGSAGHFCTLGANGSYNTRLTHLSDFPSNGYVAVRDANSDTKAGMYVRLGGWGEIWADVKNFRVANPNQPGTEIWYACPEGPEAAAYVRGTGDLVNGRAQVTLPDHFVAVATAPGMTVQVTPLSAESKGLAVVEMSREDFVVRELFGGSGTYDFDYMVMAVRQGHEDYRVIRPDTEGRPAPVRSPLVDRVRDADGRDVREQRD